MDRDFTTQQVDDMISPIEGLDGQLQKDTSLDGNDGFNEDYNMPMNDFQPLPIPSTVHFTTKKISLLVPYQDKRYVIYLNYEFKQFDQNISVEMELANYYKIEDAIKYSIQAFRKKLEDLKLNYTLDNDSSNWTLVEARKKKGKPKDEPPFARDIEISDVGVQVFCLCPKDIKVCVVCLDNEKQQNIKEHDIREDIDIASNQQLQSVYKQLKQPLLSVDYSKQPKNREEKNNYNDDSPKCCLWFRSKKK